MLIPAIATLVPHAGAMCLLDRVLAWDCTTIRCLATFADPVPLMVGGRLPSTALIEYAAQAMAAHGTLLVTESSGPERDIAGSAKPERDAQPASEPTQGWLVGLRGVELAGRWVAPDQAPFTVVAKRDVGDERQVIYTFEVRSAIDCMLCAGRATVVLDARPASNDRRVVPHG